jgi:hypothetical protein
VPPGVRLGGTVASCPSCQTAVESDAAYCPSCGRTLGRSFGDSPTISATAPAAPGPEPVGAGPGAPGAGHAAQPAGSGPGARRPAGGDAFGVLLARTSLQTRVVGVAALLTFIALFLPWYSATVFGTPVSVDGYHRWGWLTFLGMLAALAVAVVSTVPTGLTVTAQQLRIATIAAGALEAIGAIAYWIDVSSNSGGIGGPSVGLFLALIAGLATAGIVFWQEYQAKSKAAGGSGGGAPGARTW